MSPAPPPDANPPAQPDASGPTLGGLPATAPTQPTSAGPVKPKTNLGASGPAGLPGAMPPVSPPAILDDPLLAPVPVVDGAKRLGTCILTAKLGQGGMGAVYRGWHTRLNTPVAVKILPFHLATGPHAEAARQRFHREAQLAVQLDHPNLIRVMDVDESDQSLYYLIMEYVEGQTVGSALRRHLEKHNRPLPERTALSVAVQVASALAYAHGKGIIHRDIKPDNIMIRRDDGRVKVMDLGLAKAVDADEGVSMTSQGMGSPHYMSPEQASDAKHVTEASDVYALGATLYHLVTGQTAFQAPSIYALVKKIHEDPPADPRTYNPTLSDGARTIILRCLEKDPAKRPTTADLLKLLRTAAENAPNSSAVRPAVGTVSPHGPTLPSTATVPVPGAPAPAVPSAAAMPTQTAAPRKGARKVPAATGIGPVAQKAAVMSKPASPPPAPVNRKLWWLVALGGAGVMVALLIGVQWRHAVEAEARAAAVDGILRQIQPRLAVKDYDQAAALYKTMPPDADPAQIAATQTAVEAGVAARAAEMEFLQKVDARIHQLFKAMAETADRPVLQPVTRIVPLDPEKDFTPQLLMEIKPKPNSGLTGAIHPTARADLHLVVDDENVVHRLQLIFRDPAALYGYLDALAPDIAPDDPAFGVRLLKLSQNRFRKIDWLLQMKGADGTVADGTEIQLRAGDQGEVQINGHSIQMPDFGALLRKLDDNPGNDGPRRPERPERPERQVAQKFTGTLRLNAAAGQPPMDGLSRLLGILAAVGAKEEPNYPALAQELTATLVDAEVTLGQGGHVLAHLNLTARPVDQSGLDLRALATAQNRLGYQMLERLLPKLLFWMALDPKNTNLVKVDRETEPAKMQSALVLHLNNAGVQKMLKDMYDGNGFNKK